MVEGDTKKSNNRGLVVILVALCVVATVIFCVIIMRIFNNRPDDIISLNEEYHSIEECNDSDDFVGCLEKGFLKIVSDDSLDAAIDKFQQLIDSESSPQVKKQYLTARIQAMEKFCGEYCSAMILEDAHSLAGLSDRELERESLLCKYEGLYGAPGSATEYCDKVQQLLIEQSNTNFLPVRVDGGE